LKATPKRLRRKPSRKLLIFFAGLTALFLLLYGWLLYRLTHPDAPEEAARPEQFLLPHKDLRWTSHDGTTVMGWFVPGQRGAPLLVLCHGVGSSRTAVLNLATTLKESGYNVLLMTLRGHGENKAMFTMGWKEAEDLNGGIQTVLATEKVDPLRVGVWGVTAGAFGALRAAQGSDKISACVLDSVYASVEQNIGMRLKETLGFDQPWARRLLGFGVGLLIGAREADLHGDVDIPKMINVAMLFIHSIDDPDVSSETLRLYALARGKKNLITFAKTRKSILLGTEIKLYDSKVLEFFRETLPI
jgi:hypothetical protein